MPAVRGVGKALRTGVSAAIQIVMLSRGMGKRVLCGMRNKARRSLSGQKGDLNGKKTNNS